MVRGTIRPLLKMPTSADVAAIIARIVKDVAKNSKVLAVYLFGSHARVEARLGSDIDLCVIAERLTHAERIDVAAHAGKAIDVVLFDELPLDIQHDVFKDGKALFVRNAAKLEQLRHATLRKMLDWSPVMERRLERFLAA